MSYTIRLLEERDLEIVLKWRNSDRVRKNMFHDNIISFQEHLKWYQDISKDHSKCNLIFLLNENPTGIVSFNEIDQTNKHCFWGIYVGEPNTPKGTGTIMAYKGIEYAINDLKMKKISAEIITQNNTSIKFHEKLGFVKEGLFKNQHIKQGKYVDVARFTLLLDEWKKRKEQLKEDLKKNGFNDFS